MKTVAIIPAYQPSTPLLDTAKAVVDAGLTLIIVNDGSSPDCAPIFARAGELGTVLTHSENRGKGCALKTAYQYIRETMAGDFIVVTLDADGQHRVDDALRVCAQAAEHPDSLILGSRAFSGNVPARSRFGNTVTRFVYNLSTGTRVHDTQTGLRAFSSSMLEFMQGVEGERYEYEMNVLLACPRQEIPICEVEIATIYEENNTSHFSTVRDSFRIYKDIFKFAASSFLGFLVDYVMYSVLTAATGGLGAVSIPISNVGARIVSSCLNFFVNKRLVFKSDSNLLRSAAGYFALAACILIVNTLILNLLVNILGMNKFAAKLLVELLLFTASWLVQRHIIFKSTRKDKEA